MTITRHMFLSAHLDHAKMRADAYRISTTNDRLHTAQTVVIHNHRYEPCTDSCEPEVFEAVPRVAAEEPLGPADIVIEKNKEPTTTCAYCGREKPMNSYCVCPEGSSAVTIDADGTVHHE